MNTCSKIRIIAAVATVCTLSGGILAQEPDGPVAAIQQSLKRQQYYSGEVTGKYDEATKGAVRRFQIRQGLKVSGELDAATLESLAAVEKSAPEGGQDPSAPERVPARERTRQVVQGDQEFLAQIEGDEPAAAPPAGAQQAPEPSRPEPPPRREVDRPRPATPQVEAPVERQTAPPAPERTKPREEVAPAPGGDSRAREISNNDARRFVESYLAAAERATPDREISFYADRVNYFGEGRLSKQAIEKDQQSYYRRWPNRQFELIDEPEVIKASSEEATVRFRIRYNVRKGEETARGRTENVVRLREMDDGLKIIAIRERKLD